MEELDQQGIDYEIIRLDTIWPEERIKIYSNKLGQSVGYYRYGIKVDDVIYDNVTINGMDFLEWQIDYGVGEEYGIKLDYPDKILPY